MAGDPSTMLRIEVAFAWPDRQLLIPVLVAQGTTVREAIEASGILDIIGARDPEFALREDRVGVFGRRARWEDVLRDGDRVELYRPLLADPKEARRARAEADRAGRKAP
jgi:putative ubiquitin-RnfH superfamily antitoxin RatB of RatAB toxin-antitoxin module